MTFKFIPRGDYRIGQVIEVDGRQMQVESYSHTGKNVVVTTLPGSAKFERILCVTVDGDPILEKLK
jgi:hypothetical protein